MDRQAGLVSTRSLATIILSILLALQGAFELMGIPAAFVSFTGPLATSLGLINLLITLAIVVLAWGVWTRRPWVVWIAVVEVLCLGIRVFALSQPNANTTSLLLRMLFPLLIFAWLFAIRLYQSSQNREVL